MRAVIKLKKNAFQAAAALLDNDPFDDPHVNRNGNASALGHPPSMSGVRIALTAVEELHRTGDR